MELWRAETNPPDRSRGRAAVPLEHNSSIIVYLGQFLIQNLVKNFVQKTLT